MESPTFQYEAACHRLKKTAKDVEMPTSTGPFWLTAVHPGELAAAALPVAPMNATSHVVKTAAARTLDQQRRNADFAAGRRRRRFSKCSPTTSRQVGS